MREIELTRERLDSELTELQDRLPTPAQWGKRLLGVAFGGGVAGSMFWFGVRSLRKRKKRKAEQQRVQAVVQVVPDRWAERISEALENGQWKQWMAAGAGIWLLLRMAELRQLRRVNRVLVTRPGAL
ncbi:MAG: hypothetical protein E6G44_10965 [Actinobacteria bacterium]|nr:MAG: hypothetical protein E6G44_10965 [Actinomycetota bacterium]